MKTRLISSALVAALLAVVASILLLSGFATLSLLPALITLLEGRLLPGLGERP